LGKISATVFCFSRFSTIFVYHKLEAALRGFSLTDAAV
jgi:hypothetical protein